MDNLLEIGQIVNSYGIKGFLKVVPYTDNVERYDDLKTIYIEKNKKLIQMEIEEVKYHKNLVLLKLKGIDDINDTLEFKNCYIKIDRKDAIKLPEDTYFIVDLIGLEVITDEGETLGNLVDVFPTGSNDVYVVKNELGKQTLLPAIGDVIKQVDIENKKMVVHLIDRFSPEETKKMKFSVLTLFPEMFECLNKSIIGRAQEKNLIEIELINIRDFSKNKHKKVDDTPYGGGAGMVMMPDVVYDAYEAVKTKKSKVIYMSPQGKTLNQEEVKRLSIESHIILLCGHYEGIDQRVIDEIVDEEISIGDYVVTGGELPAMVVIDSVSRYIDGVLKKASIEEESFSNGYLLEYPQYTRPEEFHGVKVPEVLLSRAPWKYKKMEKRKVHRGHKKEKTRLS